MTCSSSLPSDGENVPVTASFAKRMQSNKGLKPDWLEECLRREAHVEVRLSIHMPQSDNFMIQFALFAAYS